jgi:hypothetical protein
MGPMKKWLAMATNPRKYNTKEGQKPELILTQIARAKESNPSQKR